MLATSHVLAGTLIGMRTRRVVPAFALGVLSHLAMDMVPHWGADGDPDFKRVSERDGIACLAAAGIGVALSPAAKRPAVVAGLFGALLPDLNKPVKRFFGRPLFPRRVQWFLGRIQRGRESSHRMPQEIGRGFTLLALVVLSARSLRTNAAR